MEGRGGAGRGATHDSENGTPGFTTVGLLSFTLPCPLPRPPRFTPVGLLSFTLPPSLLPCSHAPGAQAPPRSARFFARFSARFWRFLKPFPALSPGPGAGAGAGGAAFRLRALAPPLSVGRTGFW